jgi:arginyl-tRNA synthetase
MTNVVEPTLRQALAGALRAALDRAVAAGELPAEAATEPFIERTRDPKFGDFASNVAMTLARPLRKAPLQIAQAIARHVELDGVVASVEVAPPGFLNLRVSEAWLRGRIRVVLEAGDRYGRAEDALTKPVLIEYVSANPTGPLHVGHGRWAALGSTLANLLAWAGTPVLQEFYINDAGNQMLNLGRSVLYRLEGREIPAGEEGANFYGGASIQEVADRAREAIAAELDGLGEEGKIARLTAFARDFYLEAQKRTLARMRVSFDTWTSETTLHRSGEVERTLERLKTSGDVYEQDGALWLRSTAHGDDKDRVVIRDNGLPTYLAADIAYHADKLARSGGSLLNIWGADHHGYVARIQAALAALGHPEGSCEVLIGQLVSLFREGEPVRMSKRTGEMVTLDEVLDEVGPDAARYYLVMRGADTPLDFDLTLAKQETADNPVFYVQYAHARICSILRLAEEQGLVAAPGPGEVEALVEADERHLLLMIAAFPDEVRSAAQAREPHRIARYAQDLAAAFHQFYTTCRVIQPDQAALSRARLALAAATRQTLACALEGILGVSAPAKM